MKHYLFPLLTLILLASCSKDYTSEPSCNVTFNIDNLSVDYLSRATLASAYITDVWVFEGTTLLSHKVSTDADFASPVIPLTYGSHTLTFIASKAEGQTFSNKWQCTKVLETFGKVVSIDVNGSTQTRNIELSRRSSRICLGIEDAIPSSVKWMHVTVGNHLALDNALKGSETSTYDVSVDIADKVGKTNYEPMFNCLTASASDEEDIAVMVEFKNSNNIVLYHYEREVPVKPNRVTFLHGNFFSGNANAITVNTTWLDEYEVKL